MNAITPQLPTVMGSVASMLVAFISLMTGVSTETCIMKTVSAFLVFAGFGLILRHALSSSSGDDSVESEGLDVIIPGSTVGELIDAEENAATN